MKTQNPVVALGLSLLLPGLGHVYAGKLKKGLVFFCADAGVIAALFHPQIHLFFIWSLIVYPMAMARAGIEAYRIVKPGRWACDKDSRTYAVCMLLATGFSALPLLWQSRQFSRAAKIAWTAAVPVLTALFFGALAFCGPSLEKFLR